MPKSYAQALPIARNLVTEPGDSNQEYDRALANLLYDLYADEVECATGEVREHIADDLGIDTTDRGRW